jgi:hypothetical protein
MIIWTLVDYRSRNIVADWTDEASARAAIVELLADGGEAALTGLALAAMDNDDESGAHDPGPVYEGAALAAWATATSSAEITD